MKGVGKSQSFSIHLFSLFSVFFLEDETIPLCLYLRLCRRLELQNKSHLAKGECGNGGEAKRQGIIPTEFQEEEECDCKCAGNGGFLRLGGSGCNGEVKKEIVQRKKSKEVEREGAAVTVLLGPLGDGEGERIFRTAMMSKACDERCNKRLEQRNKVKEDSGNRKMGDR